jgi:intraflagellar transport protein 122
VLFIKLAYVHLSLAKVAQLLGGFKTARHSLECLQGIRVPSYWEEEVDLSNLLLRSKPYVDADRILPICARCWAPNPLVADKPACYNCRHPMVVSMVSFQVLPLVEFRIDPKLSVTRAIELFETEKRAQKPRKEGREDGWGKGKGFKNVFGVDLGTPFMARVQTVLEQQ